MSSLAPPGSTSPWRRSVTHVLLACVALLLAACAALPPQSERRPSAAMPMSASTELGAIAVASLPADTRSGFRLLPSPDSAFDARLAIVERAAQALDVQYYEVRDDQSGRALLRALRDAAQRGVRVRLLIDDLHTAGEDGLLLDFGAYPNVEVRLFNPFPGGRDSMATRMMVSAYEFGRIASSTTFLDLDLLVAGPLVARLGEHFDRYWNDPYAYRIESLVPPIGSAAERIASFYARVGCASDSAPGKLPSIDVLAARPLRDELRDGRLSLIRAGGIAVADVPDIDHLLRQNEVRESIRELARNARSELVVTTPYLIPGSDGMATFRMLRERGVSVTVVTNSLAAIDEPIAFAGYLRYREPLQRAGVDIYEIAPGQAESSGHVRVAKSSRVRLHAKSAVIDRHIVCIGSMNLDPRSDFANTETAVIVDSRELADEVLALVELVERYAAYRVRLGANGATVWESSAGEELFVDDEPETTVWDRSLPRMLEPIVPVELL